MTNSFLIITGVAIFILFILPYVLRKDKGETTAEEPQPVRFFDGPLDGKTHQVPKRPPWYTYPHLPEDQTEWEDDENHTPVPGMRFIKPLWAFYQQIEGEDYFFVRDIEEDELTRLFENGELPDPVAKDE